MAVKYIVRHGAYTDEQWTCGNCGTAWVQESVWSYTEAMGLYHAYVKHGYKCVVGCALDTIIKNF